MKAQFSNIEVFVAILMTQWLLGIVPCPRDEISSAAIFLKKPEKRLADV